jgi:hypothetical protein
MSVNGGKSHFEMTTSLLTSVVVGVVEFLFQWFTQPTQTMQAVSSATQLALMVLGFMMILSLFKRDLLNSIADKTRIYALLDQVTDSYLKGKALDVISECETRLKEIATGTLRLHAQEIYQIIAEKMTASKSNVQATHLVSDSSFISIWNKNEGLKNYLDANIKAIKSGVEVERVFLLRKTQTLDPKTNKINENIWNVLKEQCDAQIKVSVTWVEDVNDTSLIEDFVIFDETEVVITYQLWDAKYHSVAIKNNEFYTRDYLSRFRGLKSIGRIVDESFRQEFSPESRT